MIDAKTSQTQSDASSTDTLRGLESPAGVSGKFPQDGGVQAWLCVFGAFLALFCSFGQLNAFGTFQSWYAEHELQELPASTISWIGSLQLWVFFFSGGFIGRVFDTHGPRVIMIPGTVILVFSIMMTSLCKHYYQFVLAQGILLGLGIGMLFYPSLSAISTHFSRRRGTAVGIALAGSGVGGVVYPIMLRRLFSEVGFSWAVRISGFICLALCIVAVGTVSSNPSATRHSRPCIKVSVFKDVPFMLVILGSCFISLGLFIPSFYIVDYAISYSVAPATAFYVLSVMNAGGILGRLGPPWLSDALGRFNILVACVFLAGLSVLVFWTFAHSLVALMLFAALYGFFSGAFNALVVPCVAQISDIRENGARFGMLYSIISFPSLCGGPAAGALLKAHGGSSYTGMIMFSGATIVVGSLCMLWARLRIDRKIFVRV
ncbi:MFS general substrate transporter [Amylocystis lapponica]|nr:MFS general substrate transporter [Amylocystis lapponica]